MESGHCVLLLGRGACWTWAGPSLLGSMSASLVLLEMWALKDRGGANGVVLIREDKCGTVVYSQEGARLCPGTIARCRWVPVKRALLCEPVCPQGLLPLSMYALQGLLVLVSSVPEWHVGGLGTVGHTWK